MNQRLLFNFRGKKERRMKDGRIIINHFSFVQINDSSYLVSLQPKEVIKRNSKPSKVSKDRHCSTESHTYKKAQHQNCLHSPKYTLKKPSKQSKSREDPKKCRSKKPKSRRDALRASHNLNQSLHNPLQLRNDLGDFGHPSLNSTSSVLHKFQIKENRLNMS